MEDSTACLWKPSCGGVFTQEVKKRALKEASGRVVRRLETEKQLHQSGVQGLWRCPYCYEVGSGGPLRGGTTFRCGSEPCQWWSCVLCGEAAHERKLCRDEDVARTRELDSKAPLCSVCGQRGPRGRSGSNLILCRCKQAALCGACGADVTGSGYEHFSPYLEGEGMEDERYVNRCPLFQQGASRRGWA